MDLSLARLRVGGGAAVRMGSRGAQGTRTSAQSASIDAAGAPDDGIAKVPLGPLQEASVSFRSDPEVGDAAADLAEELGQNSLRAVTSGEDMSELENQEEMEPTEVGGPFVIERARFRPKPGRRRRRNRPSP